MICGKPFETIYAVQKYCSSECNKSARTMRKRDIRKMKKRTKGKKVRSEAVFRGLCSVCGADDVRVIECSECGYLVCNKCKKNESGVCKICLGVLGAPTIARARV
jgi:hypothetical protein